MLRRMSLDPVVTADEVASLTDVVLVDCRPDVMAYRAGHAPGARHAQLERDLSAPPADPARGGRHPLPAVQDFAATLGRWGIGPDTHVVAYDDQNGANSAARLWWLLRACGHQRVQVVEGGALALLSAGFGLTTLEPAATPRAPYPVTAWQRGLADLEEVEAARRAPDRGVLDVRAAFRYRGEREPFDPIAGHIPGARNVPLTDNLEADGAFRSPAALRARYLQALDGVPPEQAIIHCGSGVTACHTLLALERAGLHGAKLYVGSWSEWCRHPERAREP
jgi:thiosulfate/3-mercaptopyruvate sulfurtransferase